MSAICYSHTVDFLFSLQTTNAAQFTKIVSIQHISIDILVEMAYFSFSLTLSKFHCWAWANILHNAWHIYTYIHAPHTYIPKWAHLNIKWMFVIAEKIDKIYIQFHLEREKVEWNRSDYSILDDRGNNGFAWMVAYRGYCYNSKAYLWQFQTRSLHTRTTNMRMLQLEHIFNDIPCIIIIIRRYMCFYL